MEALRYDLVHPIRMYDDARERGDEAGAVQWARRLYSYLHLGVPAHVYAVQLADDQETNFRRWLAADRLAAGAGG